MSTQSSPSAADAHVTPEDSELFEGVEFAILLPTLNEREGLACTLKEIPKTAMRTEEWSYRILVVDGGSTDGTVDVAHRAGVPVFHQHSRGKGAALREALAWLRTRGVRFAVVMDADCTYPANLLPALMSLLESGSDLVVGVRQPVFKPTSAARDFVHRVGNSALNYAANQFAGLPFLDVCSGFWGVHVEMAHRLELETNGFEIEAELFAKAFRAGMQITQIPIPYRERIGVAKLRAARDGARILLTVLRFGRRPGVSKLPRTTGSVVRSLLSLFLMDDTHDLLVVADGSRRGDAETLVRRFRLIRPGANVVLQVREGKASIQQVPPGTPGLTVAVLPPLAAPGPTVPSAVVRLPRTARVVNFGRAGSPAEWATIPQIPSAGPSARISGGYRLELDSVRPAPLRSVQILVANVLSSRNGKELAFIRANSAGTATTVWSGSTALPDDRIRPVGPAPSEARNGGPVEDGDDLPAHVGPRLH